MDLDLHCWRFDWAGDAGSIGPAVGDLARLAEGVGVRTLSFMDHFFQMEDAAPATDPMLEGYTALGFVAGKTESLRLRLLVTGVTYRPPALLAKIVTTLDVLSGGRAELGIGAAWYEREHKGLGVEYPVLAERFERLEEALQICLQMWSDDDGPFDGKHYQLAETLCRPAPVSSPRPRILIGGGGEQKTLRLVAKYADMCNLMDPTSVAHKLKVLRGHCEDLGRDPNDIEVTVFFSPGSSPEETLEKASKMAELGVSTLVAGVTGDDPGDWLESSFGPVMDKLHAIEPARF